MNPEINHPPPTVAEASQAGGAIASALRFLRVLERRRAVVINCLMLSCALGIAYYAVATRLYESSARLLVIEQKQDQIANVGDGGASDNTMATHRELVTSPVVLEGAIQRLAPDDRIDLVDKPPHEWIKTLTRNLSATTTRRTNLINVSYRSRRPQAAAAVVRAVIESYLEFVRKNHQGSAAELKTVLTEGRDKAAAELAQKQRRLQEFRLEIGQLALPADQGVADPIVQRAMQLNDTLIAAQRRRIDLESTLASVRDAMATGADVEQHLAGIEESVGQQMTLMSLGLSTQDLEVQAEQERKLLDAQADLQRLNPFYGPNHPRIQELQQQIASLESYLRNYRTNSGKRSDPAQNAKLGAMAQTMLEQAVRQATERERTVSEAFEKARSEAAQYSSRIDQLKMYERDLARAEELHGVLCESIANVDFRQGQAPLQATVVSEPLAVLRPVSPQLRFVAIVSVLLGGAIGAAIVYVQDVLDDRFDSPEELTAQLGVPVLALVRTLERLEGDALAGVHTHATPTGPAAESFRTLRTALTLNAAASGRILVSSAEPGDGKTTVAVNLAVAFAQSGKRTLVIDADLRKPGLTTRLGLKSHPGVADLLTTGRPVGEVAREFIHRADEPDLDVLPTGMRRPNPAELLGSPQFGELLAWAESQYDQVLVDCPPVLAVSDAQMVGRLVDGCLLVVRPEKNHRRLVVRAVDSFHSTGCEVLGVVANGISTDLQGYGYGYGYGYGQGYESEKGDDDPQVLAAREFETPVADQTPPEIRPRRAA